MKRVDAASGAKYSFQKETPRTLRNQPSNTVSSTLLETSKPALLAAARPVFGGAKPASSVSALAKPVSPAATRPVFGGSGGASAGPAAASQSAAARLPGQVLPTAAKARFPFEPAASLAHAFNMPTKLSTEDERIASAESACKPDSLPPRKKLRNPFVQLEQQSQQQESVQAKPMPKVGMTRSKRHAAAKRERGEEEIRNWEAGVRVLQGRHICTRNVSLDFND
ncbi:actin binding protein [Marasmius crinis-equi]|uniref:Actin binding protein n=1 Tax=Marasmius crinis-equi TaxID=585013 RepID=A0ABR3F4Z5_9AGAR